MVRLYLPAMSLVLAGCALVSQVPPRQPLQNEGEIYVELQPLGADAARIVFEIQAVAALHRDGDSAPLAIALETVSADSANRQRLLATGKLEPGPYEGLTILIRRATVATTDGRADMLVSAEPLRVLAPFTITARRAVVLDVQFRFPAAQKVYAFTPSVSAAVPAKTLVQLSGYCSNAGSHDVTVYDKIGLQVTAVLPTGRTPWGLALDPVQNRVYVALAADDQVAIVDIASGAELSRIRLNAGDSPRELLLTSDRRLLLSANAGSNTVSFIDPVSMIETGRVRVSEEPVSLLLDRNAQRAYVFHARSNSISVVDLATRTVAATVPTDNRPLRGQIDRAGARLYVATPLSAYLTVLSLPDLGVAKRVYVGIGTTALKVDPDTDLLYVANGDGRISIFDPFSLIPVDSIDLPGGATWLSIEAAQNALFALLPERRAIAVVQLTTKAVLGQLDTGLEPRVVALIGERN
jgi:YVTN family beta-propeller protein